MLKVLRVFGILFSAATIILVITFFGNRDQVIMSWTIMGMCGALIFNGGTTYFKTKDKMDALSSIIGIILLIVSLTQLPFLKERVTKLNNTYKVLESDTDFLAAALSQFKVSVWYW